MECSPEILNFPMPKGSPFWKAAAGATIQDEKRTQSAGCSTLARDKEDGPVIWEALPLLHDRPGQGDPGKQPRRGRVSPAREPRQRTSCGGEGRPERGEPKRGHEGVQGVGGPNMSEDIGERWHPDPVEQKGARAGVNLWGGT